MNKYASEIVRIILNEVQHKYAEDVDLVVLYGSYVTGKMKEKSDVDFYYVPKPETDHQPMISFIVDDVGYDFWPIGWKRLIAISEYKVPLQDLLEHGKIIYAKDLESYNKFEDLKNKLKSFQGFDQLIVKELEHAKLKLFNYPKEDMDVIYHLSNSIAHFNHTYLKKGLDNIEEEINLLMCKPESFLSLMKRYLILPSEDLLKTMLSVTEEYVCKKREEEQPDLIGFYEEFKSRYNKIYGETDLVKRHMFVHAVTQEIKNFFGSNSSKFPAILVTSTDSEIKAHEDFLVGILKKKKVPILSFSTAEEFEKYLNLKQR